MNLKQKIARLAQLRRLQDEVDMLSQRIAELELAAQGGEGQVTGLPGRPPAHCEAQLSALWERLDARRTQCLELMGALYAFIDDIDDSLMRQIFTYRYIDGRSWQSVARKIGEPDEQYPRRLHNRFLSRTPLSPGPEFDENDGEKAGIMEPQYGKGGNHMTEYTDDAMTVEIADRPLKLRYTINSLCALEVAAGMPIDRLLDRQFSATRLLLWAGLKPCQPELTLCDTGVLIGEEVRAGGSLEALVDLCADGLRAAGLLREECGMRRVE